MPCLSQYIFEGMGNKMLFLLYTGVQQNLQVQYTSICCWEMLFISFQYRFSWVLFQHQLNLFLLLKKEDNFKKKTEEENTVKEVKTQGK